MSADYFKSIVLAGEIKNRNKDSELLFTCSTSICQTLNSRKESHAMNARDELTRQEKVVLSLVAQGWRTAKIAQELYLSPRTVETHIYHIYDKLGVSSRVEAALFALQNDSAVGTEVRRNSEDLP